MVQGGRDERVSPPDVSILLVNYNTTDLLVECLRSVDQHLHAGSYEVIVVDNASTDFVPAVVHAVQPEASIIRNERNLGFAQANNAAASVARGRYLWMLNPDTRIGPRNGLEQVVRFLDLHPSYAAAAPLLVTSRGDPQANQRSYHPSVWRMILEKPARGLAPLVPQATRPLRWIDYNFNPLEEADVPVAVGAALFVRRDHFGQVGGFSPEYFMFLEDSDLCRKLSVHGYGVRFMPAAQVIHYQGASIADDFERKGLYYDSLRRYHAKWSPPWVGLVLNPLADLALMLHRGRRNCPAPPRR